MFYFRIGSMFVSIPKVCLGQSATGRPPSQSAATRALVICSSNGKEHQNASSLKKMIDSKGAILVPGVYDALSAKVLRSAGLQAGLVSGAAVSATMLGEPDLGLLTPTEMATRTAQICAAVPGAAFIADAGTAGSSVLSVQRTIRQLIAAGAKGCVMEDQVWPKRRKKVGSKEVLPMAEFVGKVVAAREAAEGADFFVIARTDARGTSAKTGLEDAVRRANLYVDAGAHASLVDSPRGLDELRIVGAQTKGVRVCTNLEGGLTPLSSFDELAGMGFHIVLHPLTALYSATHALVASYNSLASHQTTTKEQLAGMVSWKDLNTLLGAPERLEQVERFARGGGLPSGLTVRVRAPVKAVALGPFSKWPRKGE